MKCSIKKAAKKVGYIHTERTWVMPFTLVREGELLAFLLSIEIARSSGNAGLETTCHRTTAIS